MPVAIPTAGGWTRIPVILRAVFVGLAIGMVPANVWPILLIKLDVPLAAGLEVLLLALYVFWASGNGPPRRLHAFRSDCFRVRPLPGGQWLWGLTAALCFAATVHAAIVVLFRLLPYPAESFHRGYDLSLIPSRSMQWLACIVSALSAAICEETGFRGYMQRPIERRHGPAIAIVVSSSIFTLVHLNKDWALIGMVPVIFCAGLLLGRLANASGTLVFGMIGHAIMDVGLFAFWWTQIAGVFTERTIFVSGVDAAFAIECAALVMFLAGTLASIHQLKSFGT